MNPKPSPAELETERALARDFLAVSPRKFFHLERASILRSLTALARHVRGPRVLDVGCGRKPYARVLAGPGTRYWGIDYPVTMAHSYGAGTRADVFGDCLRLPFRAGSVDSVISTQVLEHVGDPGAQLREMARVLKPDGVILLSAPMLWPLHEEPYDFYRYTVFGLRHLLQEAGFAIVAEHQRGHAATALAQAFLELHLGRRAGQGLGGRVYSSALAWGVNHLALACERLWPNPRLCLGVTVVARKRPALPGAYPAASPT